MNSTTTSKAPNERIAAAQATWNDQASDAIEKAHPEGLSVPQILEALAARGERLTEATFRKYVQLGLLPRSVRVGRKGKHRGSQGLYPATVVRQIDAIRRLMAQGHTIEEIQREFFFARGELDELERQLARVCAGMEQALVRASSAGPADEVVRRAFEDARALGDDLVRRLRAIEQRLTMRARMAKAVV